MKKFFLLFIIIFHFGNIFSQKTIKFEGFYLNRDIQYLRDSLAERGILMTDQDVFSDWFKYQYRNKEATLICYHKSNLINEIAIIYDCINIDEFNSEYETLKETCSKDYNSDNANDSIESSSVISATFKCNSIPNYKLIVKKIIGYDKESRSNTYTIVFCCKLDS